VSFTSSDAITHATFKDGKTRSPGVLGESSISLIWRTVARRGIACCKTTFRREERGINMGIIGKRRELGEQIGIIVYAHAN